MKRLAVAALVLFGSLLAPMSSGSAQDNIGSLRIRYVYPDGSLATDAAICLQGFSVWPTGETPFAFGESGIDVGADSTTQLTAGKYVFYNLCDGGTRGDVPAIWNTGNPAFWFSQDGDAGDLDPAWRYAAQGEPALVRPGETTVVTVPMGKSIIRGTLSGEFISNDDCSVEAIGEPFGPFAETVAHGWTTFDGSDYKLIVPPGSYRVSAKCRFASAPRYWPNSTPFLEHAELITVANAETRSDIDLAPPSTGGTSSWVYYTVSEISETVPHCADYYRADLDGALVQRQHSDQVNGPRYSRRLPYGQYKIRIWDCAGEGFGDVWYPNAFTDEDAETIDVTAASFDVVLPDIVHVIPAPEHVCDGRRATIIGTEGDDTIHATDGADVIVGLGGNDVIRGRGGNDTICGGPGRDRLFGGHGRDRVFGGNRNDIVKGDGGKDALFGGSGNDRLFGGGGADTLSGGAGTRDRLIGRGGPDTCTDPGPETFRTECENG